MLYDAVSDPESRTPAELQAAYVAELRDVVDAVGSERAVADAGVDEDRLAALVDGDGDDLTLEEAAKIRALDPDAPDAETIVFEVRDHLLMGMTTGVVDVDTVASNADVGLSGQEVQQAIEGRVPLTLAQLAAIQQFIEERSAR